MKVLLMSIGTRGDMEPFLAIGEILTKKGHRVICAFPEQFRGLTEDSNMEFASLGAGFIEMLDSDAGKAALGGGGSGFKKFLANVKLAKNSTAVNKELIHRQYELIENEDPDRIVYNGKVIYPIIWGLDHTGETVLVSPVPYMHYVKNHAHVAFNGNYGSFFNKLTFSLANFGMVTTTMISKKWLKLTKKITRKQIRTALSSNKAIYTISPSLFPSPEEWKENLKVLGYQQPRRTIKREPDKDLGDFLGKHRNNRILFITFGSMLNPDPAEKTRIILEILERNEIPAIINTAAGGLIRPERYDSELIHFVSRIPYDRIFPKIYAVIHHGGAGTTHLALKHGCAQMIIPHIIDQFVWNTIIGDSGAGPKGMKIGKITTKNLEPKILELLNNRSFKENAERAAVQMKKEDFREEVYQTIMES